MVSLRYPHGGGRRTLEPCAASAYPDPYDLIARLARLVAGDSLVGDLRLVTVLVALGGISVVLVPPDRPSLPVTLALVVAVSVTATMWRRNPLLGVVLAAPFAAILASAGAVLPAVAGPGLLLAATADHASPQARRRLIWIGAFGAAIGIEMLSDLDLPESRGNFQSLVLSGVLWAAALYVGTEQRRRREAAEALQRLARARAAAWPAPRSGRGSPAICTTRSATPST